MRSTFLALTLFLGLVSSAAPVRAQSVWLNPERANGFTLEFAKLTRAISANSYDFDSIAILLDTKFRLTDESWLVGDLPFVHVQGHPYVIDALGYPPIDGNPPQNTLPVENTLGNPYFGIRHSFYGILKAMELGLTFPVVDESKDVAIGYGTAIDVDRYGSFIPHLMTMRLMGELSGGQDSQFWRLRVGPDLLVPTGNDKGPVNLLLHAGVQSGVESEHLRTWVGLNSVSVLSKGSFLAYGDKTSIQIAAGANFHLQGADPGVLVALTEIGNEVTLVYGLNLTLGLP